MSIFNFSRASNSINKLKLNAYKRHLEGQDDKRKFGLLSASMKTEKPQISPQVSGGGNLPVSNGQETKREIQQFTEADKQNYLNQVNRYQDGGPAPRDEQGRGYGYRTVNKNSNKLPNGIPIIPSHVSGNNIRPTKYEYNEPPMTVAEVREAQGKSPRTGGGRVTQGTTTRSPGHSKSAEGKAKATAEATTKKTEAVDYDTAVQKSKELVIKYSQAKKDASSSSDLIKLKRLKKQLDRANAIVNSTVRPKTTTAKTKTRAEERAEAKYQKSLKDKQIIYYDKSTGVFTDKKTGKELDSIPSGAIVKGKVANEDFGENDTGKEVEARSWFEKKIQDPIANLFSDDDETVSVITPDGKTGKIPKKNVDKALKKGYRLA